MSTRDLILKEALELFVEHGFHGCSMRMLARACGIRESSLYNHFPNKNAIFEAVLAQSGPEVVPRLVLDLMAREDLPPFATALKALADDVLAAWLEPLHQSLYLLSLREPEAAGGATGRSPGQSVQQALDATVRLFRLYVERGEIRQDADLEYIAWLFLAPLANLRLTLLAPAASEAEREKARDLIGRHVDLVTVLLLVMS